MNNDIVTRRYTSGDYGENNPDWDASDSPWKAVRIQALLDECGFEVIEARYTGAAYSAPNRGLLTRFSGLFRRFVRTFMGDVGVRFLGGRL